MCQAITLLRLTLQIDVARRVPHLPSARKGTRVELSLQRPFRQEQIMPVRRGKQPNIVIAVCARMSSVDCFLNLF